MAIHRVSYAGVFVRWVKCADDMEFV